MLTISIVVNFDSDEEIKNVILKISEIAYSFKICIIDNGKINRSYLKNYPNTEYYFMGKHIGYAPAHNLAMEKIIDLGKYHLVCNVDIDFEPRVINKMLEYMELNINTGLIGPKIINKDGTIYNSVKYLPKPYHLLLRKFFNKYLDSLINDYIIDNENINNVVSCTFISGCFLFFRSKELKKIGFFDDNYFLFNDDLDICRKIKKISKIEYNPSFEIIHNHGRIHSGSLSLTLKAIKSSIYYFNKWGWFFDKERRLLNLELKSNLKN